MTKARNAVKRELFFLRDLELHAAAQQPVHAEHVARRTPRAVGKVVFAHAMDSRAVVHRLADDGAALAQNRLRMVFGGGRVGLMGEAAKACKTAGGRVTGITTEKLDAIEGLSEHCDESRIVATMPERRSVAASALLSRLDR